MPRLVLLSDRPADQVLPALAGVDVDVKVEPLSVESLAHLPDLAPVAVLVDAGDNPPHAHGVLGALAAANSGIPLVAVVERGDLDRYPWAQWADDFFHPESPPAELSTRLAILRRRVGSATEDTIRLGRLSLSTDTYRVALDGRPLDLTYKEFELMRYLASHRDRVFTRAALLREVLGYDFYGGTRTVDVHVRRLRAKLGPEHEHLIETVRGVGYRATVPEGER